MLSLFFDQGLNEVHLGGLVGGCADGEYSAGGDVGLSCSWHV